MGKSFTKASKGTGKPEMGSHTTQDGICYSEWNTHMCELPGQYFCLPD